MSIIESLILSIIGSGLYEQLKDTFGENQTKRLIEELKRTAASASIELHENELYYHDLDVYILENKIVPLLTRICHDKGSSDFRPNKKFAKEKASLFIEQNKQYIGSRNVLIKIFEDLYATIDSALNIINNQDVRAIVNAVKEGNAVLGDEINEASNRVISEIKENLGSEISKLRSDMEVATEPAFKSFPNAYHSHSLYLTSQPPITTKEFSHRNETIEELYEAIKQNRRLALINGLGGIGKTTIARALYHKVKNEFKHIAWVEYQHNIKDSLLNSFTIFNAFQNDDTETRCRRIEDFLQSATKDTLIFIDNVTDDGGIDLIERFDVNVVITSRIENIGNFETFPIDSLSEEQCVDIFYKYYDYKKYDKEQKHKETVRKLVDLVKCHTLSVELLARAANRPGRPLDKYEAKLRAEGFGYPDLGVETAHSPKSANPQNLRTIAEHLVKLFKLIDVNPEQQRILKNFSVMPSVEIPAKVEKWLDCHINDLMRLTELGWLNTGSEECSGAGYYMHPIIKEAIRLQYNPQYEDCKALINYMSGKKYIKETDVYTKVNDRLSIAEAVMMCFYDVKKEEIGVLFHNMAVVYMNQGEYDKALEWYQKALDIVEKTLDPDTATTYNNMALVYDNQGKYDKALEWFQKSLYILLNKLGINHPHTSILMENMQYAYKAHYGEDSDFVEWLKSLIDNLMNHKT